SFHPAAIRLGKTLNAQMVLWGGVIDAGSEVRLQSFLTPIPEVWNPLLEVSLWRRGDRNSSSVAHLPQELDRLAFPSRVAEPAALFSAPIAARCNLSAGCPTGVPIHGSPADNSVLPKGIAEGTPLRIVGARGKWLQVVLPNDERVWINLYHAD